MCVCACVYQVYLCVVCLLCVYTSEGVCQPSSVGHAPLSLQVQDKVISDRMERTETYLEHIIGNWSRIKAFEEGTVAALHRAVAAAGVQCHLVLQSNASASSSPLRGHCMELEEYLPTLDSEGAGEVVRLMETDFLPVVRQIVSGSHSKVWHTVYKEEVVGGADGRGCGVLSW